MIRADEGMTEIWDLLVSGDAWTWTWQILLIPVTLVYYDILEWLTHKYISHGLGRSPKSFYNFHWSDHHRHVRKNGFYDDEFKGSLFSWNAQGKEALLLTLTALLYLPLFFIAPFCYLTLIYGSLRYRWVHRRAHTDPAWAKIHVPWHYEHHMGVNQNANWGVTSPWMDWLMGTRECSLKQKGISRFPWNR